MLHVDEKCRSARHKLTLCVHNGKTKSEVIFPTVEEILHYSTSFGSRYLRIRAAKLVKDNCYNQNSSRIADLITALGILEKYGKNLVRPEPPPQWRVVRLSNAIFHTKVDIIKGSRDILIQMGYTERIADGFSFPSHVQLPNREVVSLVTSDVILLKYELAMYQKNQHPNAVDIIALLHTKHEQSLHANTEKHVHKKDISSMPQIPTTSSAALLEDLCAVCGLKPAEFHCDVCQKKQCNSCDGKWHQYPKRVAHKRTRIYLPTTRNLLDNTPYPLATFQKPDTRKSSSDLSCATFPKPDTQKSSSDLSYSQDPLADVSRLDDSSLPHGYPLLTPTLYQNPADRPSTSYDTYSSAKPIIFVPADRKPSQENLKWEDRFALKKQELLSEIDLLKRRKVLDHFCEEIDEQIKKYQDGARRLDHSSFVKQHLLERSEFLLQEKNDLKKHFGNIVHENTFLPAVVGNPNEERLNFVTVNNTQEVDESRATWNFLSNLERSPKETTNEKNTVVPELAVKSPDVKLQPSCSAEPVQRNQISNTSASHLPASEQPLPATFSRSLTIDELKACTMRADDQINSMKMIDYLRTADLGGYSLEQVKITVNGLSPENFAELSDHEQMSEKLSEQLQPILNDNPDMVLSEASSVFSQCNGDYDLAQKVIKDKLTLKKKIVSHPQLYSDEDAEKCLMRNKYNCAKALCELQQPFMQNFLDRLQKPQKEKLFVKDFVSMNDKSHAKDALVALLSINEVSIANTMCSIIFRELEVTESNADLFQVLDGYDIQDVLEASQSFPDNIDWALKYLSNKCKLCLDLFPHNKIECMTTCGDNGCTYCQECLAHYLEIKIKEGHIRDLVCPVCNLPDIDDDEETATNHFNYLDVMIKKRLSEQTHAIFQQKVRDQTLMKMPNFRWCSHCEFGFLYEFDQNNLKMVCSQCHKATCYNCKKPWEDQHEGLSCQAFMEWKQMNDADFQAEGLAAHLKENGIDCPFCNFRYTLAKGGCMHFKCIMCSYQFCSGCKSPFKQGQVCNVLTDCFKKGFHAHHPRDCLFYLRDLNIDLLQKILSDADIHFDTESKRHHNYCQVPEQKETSIGMVGTKLVDDVCGREVRENSADLCVLHYKEYLVNLVNGNRLDPATVFSAGELTTCLMRNEKNLPVKTPQQTDDDYRVLLLTEVKKLPLIHEKGRVSDRQKDNVIGIQPGHALGPVEA